MSQTSRLAFAGALKAAVEENGTSGLIVYPPSFCVAAGVPNVTLTNSIGQNTPTQFAFATIPAGAMGASSQLQIQAFFSKAGSTGIDILCRFGAASGNFATATPFGGQSGLTTQQSIAILPEIWNTGTLNNQLANAVAMTGAQSTSGAALVAGTVDTSLDWNIYFGLTYTGAPIGGDSVTLRKFRITIAN